MQKHTSILLIRKTVQATLTTLQDRESEIGIRIRFVAQREMPPFMRKGAEATGRHGIAEQLAIFALFVGNIYMYNGNVRQGSRTNRPCQPRGR